MHIDKIVDGVVKYAERTIVPTMTGIQEGAFYALAELIKDNHGMVEEIVGKNFFLRSMIKLDKEGNINLEQLTPAVRRAISRTREKKISFTLPGYGSITLNERDVNELLDTIEKEDSNATHRENDRPYQ
jgi:hypothetical protein